MTDNAKEMPSAVVRRLVRYLNLVDGLVERKAGWVSSKELAEAIGSSRSTVRMDISYLRVSGSAESGYPVKELKKALKSYLGVCRRCNVVIVGAGNMGRALALHREFAAKGFTICGIFDSDPKLLKRPVGALRIRGMGALADVVRRKRVHLAILAVPSAAAQEVADTLVRAGVRGILNLACAELSVPDSVAVVATSIAADLRRLCFTVRTNTGGKCGQPPSGRG